MYPNSSAELNSETEKQIFFFTPAFHPLDNYSAHVVDIWDRRFPTAEHAYHWKKFEHNQLIADDIFSAISPEMAKQIAEQNKSSLSNSWHDMKRDIMKEILIAKTIQHDDVRGALRRTSGREIIENSPVDSYWGIGPDKNGHNEIGKIWMEIRKDQGLN